jgi:hypothetical protein
MNKEIELEFEKNGLIIPNIYMLEFDVYKTRNESLAFEEKIGRIFGRFASTGIYAENGKGDEK